MNVISLKNKFIYSELLLLILIKNISPFCVKSQKFENSFPSLSDSERFYLKKVSDDYFIVGNEKEATAFNLPDLDREPYETTVLKKISFPYKVYSDSFGNMNPIIVGTNTIENPYNIKYILSEGIISQEEFDLALYDVKQDELREGQLSYGFKDFKILETLNEKEFIGAVQLYNSGSKIYSIKLQIMSFTQTSKGYIKQLSGKEYASTTNVEQNVNNIFYIETLKKILVIRTIQDEVYFDFIDYDSYFGALQISKIIKAPFNVKDYRFYSVILSKEYKKTYIASCFRKLNLLYCYSGYYDEEIVDFVFLKESPKLMLSSCSDKKYNNVALYKVKSGIGIVGCSGNPYYAIRFNKTLDIIGSPIILPKPYSEFLVLNSSTLFVMYSDNYENTQQYELYGCIYYLPVCQTQQKFFINIEEEFDFKLIIKDNDELKLMNDISIIKSVPGVSGTYSKIDDNGNSIQINNIQTDDELKINNLYYTNNVDDSSYEEIIYYKTFTKKDLGVTGDESAYSQECILSIVRCYKSCKKCDDLGDIHNNNCLECFDEESRTYFVEDKTSKQCLSVAGDGYYFDASNNVFKRCYSGCLTCNKAQGPTSHNCINCDEDNKYYKFKEYYDPSANLYDCYLDTQPPIGYYFDKDDEKFKSCPSNPENECATCIRIIENNGEESINCKRCKTSDGYYAYFEDDEKTNAQCLNRIPAGGYYLDEKAGEYKKCYPSCATCSRAGTDEFNNCDTCNTDFELHTYSIDSSTCICTYNFYYKRDANNKKIFTCTEGQNCPNETGNKYPYLIINSQNIRQCVSSCPSDYPYIYNYQCYNHIPNGTSLIDDSLYNCGDDDVNYDQCIVNDYITSSVPLNDISKVEKDYVNNYRTQYTNTANNDYTYNHANLVRNNNDEYILLIFENEKCVEKIISEYGLGYTDLTDYSPKIKSQNGIDENEPLIYSYLYTYNDPINGTGTPVENLTYSCYNSETGQKISIDDILEGENITQYVPAPSGSDLQKLNYLSKYSNLGIDFSDPNSDFFNSQCFLFTSDNGKDVTLADRRKFFFNNIKICEDDCVFSGINEDSNTAMCSCPYKSSTSGGGQTVTKAVTFPDYDEDYFIFDMWKCLSKKMVKGKELKKSYIAIIVFCILLLTILLTILYFCCYKNRFQFLSQVSTKYSSISRSSQLASRSISIQNQKKSNPPKKSGDDDNDSELMKEKGYVHDVKRPFNYDNNNLFFHADEHYTIGNNNLNSLFIGQNFKNDYDNKIQELDNNERKPKQVINNYKNVNIPGKKINKNNSKKHPKVNNYNNINIGPDIVTIKDSNPEPSNNKDTKTRNGPIIIKNDSDIDSVDPLRKEKISAKSNIINISKNKKNKPDDSSEKSYTNYSNKRSLISNKNNNSLTGKVPEFEKEDDVEFDNDIKNACKEIGEENMKINKADYNSATQTDFRDFCSFYFNQIKHRQIFFYTGYFHKYAENLFMKIMIILFHILLCLFLNLFWYRTYYVHSEFISPITNHSTFSSKYSWFRILLSVLFYVIIICLLHLIYLPQLRIYYSLSNDKISKSQKLKIMEKNIKCMKINYIIFIVINFCFLIVLLLYTLVFSYVFQNSKTDLMISFILTVIITQALPFVFVFFVTVFRFIGLKCNCPCSYDFSLFFTI